MGRWWWPPFSPTVHGRNNTEVGGGGNGQGSGEGALTSKYIQNPIPFHHLHHYQLGHNHQHPPPGFLLWLPNGLLASNLTPHPISSPPEVGATLLEPTSDHVPPLLRTLPWHPQHSEQKPRFLQWPARPYMIVIWLLSPPWPRPLLLSGVLDVHGIYQSRLRLQAFAPAVPSACNAFPPEICFPKLLTWVFVLTEAYSPMQWELTSQPDTSLPHAWTPFPICYP